MIWIAQVSHGTEIAVTSYTTQSSIHADFGRTKPKWSIFSMASKIAPPTIKVSLQNMPFRFFFLGDLLGFRDMQIPSAATTMTGEDLYSCSPIMRRGCSGFP